MDSSLRLVPSSRPKAASIEDTANGFGLHDTLTHGPRSLAAEVQTVSVAKERLENWEETQDNLKLNMQRNVYGLHAPVRQLMERSIVSFNPHMPTYRTTNVHLDILMGRDETVEPADFMTPASAMSQPLDIRAEMEKRHRL
ncbi:proteasome maturation factor UMP1 [Phanerochaete sordida]|uniref:Proteasome maturation factor UMP1 n=1 Tax=Phanerochaete sordida TaxID=48140 RepID=A0A9P3GJ03_9APHY|nr:proteasome maturation factor UMP1 [Phanerochaete sordida]